MSNTHGGMITLYERVSTIHHLHIVMVPLIVNIYESTQKTCSSLGFRIHAGHLCVNTRTHGNRAFGSFVSLLRMSACHPIL